ncbi:MAG TPA: ABC transporter permease subunit, partial [Chloroflexota bacterium]|nr:ABC transporter permease subunit [Chloroflexota bacterium]
MNDPKDVSPAPIRARRRRSNPVVAETGEALQEESAVAVEEPAVEELVAHDDAAAPLRQRPRRRGSRAASASKTIASYPLRNVGTIAGKELYSYFASPIAYLVIAAFLVMNGYLFSIILFSSRSASLTGEFGDMAIILLFLSPAITMRLLSEEQRSGTIELLLTSPLRESELVLGKWLASMGFFLVMLIL